MADGKAKATKQRRREAVKRVLAFRKWLDDGIAYDRQKARWLDTGEKMTVKKPQPPVTGLPSDTDFEIAREEGAIT